MRSIIPLIFAAFLYCQANAQIPTLSSFSPLSAKIGKTVVLNGTNFHANKDSSIVYFGTTVADILSATSTQLQVTVPTGASYGPISVYSKGYTVTSNLSFIPTFDGASFNANSFGPNIDFNTASLANKMIVADLNLDKKPDILNLRSDHISVYKNKADSGMFNDTSLHAEWVLFGLGNDTLFADMMVSDFNHDSLPDIIALVHYQKNSILPANVFERKVFLFFYENTSDITTISFSKTYTVLIRDGVLPMPTCTGGPYSDYMPVITRGLLSITDLNYDAVPDFMITLTWENYLCPDNCSKYNIEIFSATGVYSPAGSPGFSVEYILQTSCNGRFLNAGAGDMNNDGKQDLVASYYVTPTSGPSYTNTDLFTNTNSQGGLVNNWALSSISSVNYPNHHDISVLDIDQDNKPDIFRSTGYISHNIHSAGNLSPSSFEALVSLSNNSGFVNTVWTDINGDTKPDPISLKPSDYKVTVMQNHCIPGVVNASLFTLFEYPVIGSQPSVVCVNDLDKDGKPEIITSNTNNTLSVLKNLITAEFVLDTVVCANENDTITYTGSAGAGATYTWEFDGATVISGSGQGPLIVSWNTPGVKTVTLTIDENGNQTIVSRNVTVLPVPTSTFDLPQYIYVNTPNTITYTGTASNSATYTWNFDGGNILSGSDQGPFSVMWTLAGNRQISLCVEEDGCYSDTTIITKTINSIWQEERLCVVTVDPVSGKNLIVWEKSVGPDIASYLIYKEISTNFYSAIGMVPYSDMSTFLDVNSNPGAYPAKYKLSILDSQGSESQKSPYHKTIHLQASQGVPSSTINLQWTDYYDEEGVFVPAMYYIYRGTQPDNLTLLDSVSGSITTYSDMNVFSVYYYMVGVERAGGCNATAKAIFDGSMSNIKDISGLVNVSNIPSGNCSLVILPNPASGWCNITIPESESAGAVLMVCDITGKIIEEHLVTGESFRLDTRNLFPGIYLIRLSGSGTYYGRLSTE